jgi:hypothetical protein
LFSFHEKYQQPLTIVWVSNPARPKLPSRVRRLGQKVPRCRNFGERRPLDFALQCEGSRARILDFLQFDWWNQRPLAFGHSVKGPLVTQHVASSLKHFSTQNSTVKVLRLEK